MPVLLENQTFGTAYSASTSAAGFANLTAPAGWYWLEIGEGSARIPSFESYDLKANGSATRYLLPATDATVSVGNGPAGAAMGARYVHAACGWDPFGFCPGVQVDLLNASSSDALLGTAQTGINGSASFTHLDTAFSYALQVDGFGDPLTGARWASVNESANALTSAANQTFPVTQITTTTGTVTGTALPGASSYRWSLSGPATITGGVTYWSLQTPVGSSVHFVDALVYVNGTGAALGGFYQASVSFTSSVVVFLEPGIYFQRQGETYYNSSIEIGTEVAGAAVLQFGGEGGSLALSLGSGSCSSSLLEDNLQVDAIGGSYLDCELANVTAGSGGVTFANSTLDNVTLESAGVGWTAAINGVYAYNSTLLWGESQLTGTNDRLQYTDLVDISGNVDLNRSWINASTTLAAYAAGKEIDWGNPIGNTNTTYLAQDYISLVQQPGYNLTVENERIGSLHANGGWNTTQWYFANRTNVTYSVLNFTNFGRGNVSLVFGSLWLFEDWVRVNYTNAQLLMAGTGSAADPVKTGIIAFDVTTASAWFCRMDVGTMYVLDATDSDAHQGPIAFEHDLFPLTFQVFPFAQTQFFGATHSANEAVLFSNDTWTFSEWNTTVIDYTHHFASAGSGDVAIQDMGGTGAPTGGGAWSSEPPGWLNVTYCTFWGRPLGQMAGSGADWLLLGQYNIRSYVGDDVFENSNTYSLNQTYFSPTYSWDVANGGQNNTYNHDWFLNLTNITLPIGSDDGAPGINGFGQFSRINLGSDVHFYYAPKLPGQTTLNPAGPTLPAQNVTGSPTVTDPTINGAWAPWPLESTVTYEIPLIINGSLVAGADANQLVFNESNRQAVPCNFYGFMPFTPCAAWSWGIAPDVTEPNGIPIVDYSTGLNAGPQPSFVWHGFRYNTSVEAGYVQVRAPVANPGILVGFSGLDPGTSYVVTTYDLAAAPSSVTLTVPTNGTIEVPYTPSVEGTNATFVAAYQASSPPSFWGAAFLGVPLVVWLAAGAFAVIAGVTVESRRISG